MMFGTRDPFDYLECGKCGTLQILEVPDLSRYYPKDYYSLQAKESAPVSLASKIRLTLRRAESFLLSRNNRLSRLVFRKQWNVRRFFPGYLREPLLALEYDSRILDFGCGAGQLLQALYHYGFRDLTGADAFIESDVVYANGVRIYKRALAAIEPYFDLVMLHHTFEHLPDPRESLDEIYGLLQPGGFCLIRMPVKAFAWEKYGVNWVQLDPPRHIFLYSEQSFRAIAENAGFEMAKVVYDSGTFQFYGSEQYARNIALNEKPEGKSFAETLSTSQLRKWEYEAARLNSERRGDQACFYLRKPF